MASGTIREIHLFDSFVAGTTHLGNLSDLKEIKVGGQLSLLRKNNKFDSNAILILTADKKKLVYVSEKDNIIFARLLTHVSKWVRKHDLYITCSFLDQSTGVCNYLESKQ